MPADLRTARSEPAAHVLLSNRSCFTAPHTKKTPATAAAQSAFERFLQLPRDFVGRGLNRALHDFGGTRKRRVECFFDGRLADRDKPCLVSSEFLSRIMEFLARQSPAPEPLRDDTDVRTVNPPDNAGFAVLLTDDGRVFELNRGATDPPLAPSPA